MNIATFTSITCSITNCSKNVKSYLDVGFNYMMSMNLPLSLKTHNQEYLSHFVLVIVMTSRPAVEGNYILSWSLLQYMWWWNKRTSQGSELATTNVYFLIVHFVPLKSQYSFSTCTNDVLLWQEHLGEAEFPTGRYHPRPVIRASPGLVLLPPQQDTGRSHFQHTFGFPCRTAAVQGQSSLLLFQREAK